MPTSLSLPFSLRTSNWTQINTTADIDIAVQKIYSNDDKFNRGARADGLRGRTHLRPINLIWIMPTEGYNADISSKYTELVGLLLFHRKNRYEINAPLRCTLA